MSYLNIGDYNDEVANISSQYTNLLTKADESFNVKEKANQIVESVGSVKAFMSGKPISKYLFSKGKDALDDAVKKAGVQLKNVRSEFQAGKNAIQSIPKTDNIIGRVGSQLNTEGTATETVVATPIAPDVIGTPNAPIGPGKPCGSSLKKTVLGLAFRNFCNFFLFFLAQALILCIETLCLFNSPCLIKANPIERYG